MEAPRSLIKENTSFNYNIHGEISNVVSSATLFTGRAVYLLRTTFVLRATFQSGNKGKRKAIGSCHVALSCFITVTALQQLLSSVWLEKYK